ncbi:Asp23/Gls24 family envelope stress response protein, partial [Streptomyces sp. NPDC005166]
MVPCRQPPRGQRKGAAAELTKRGGGDPATRGRTTIADGVVEKIAGMA